MTNNRLRTPKDIEEKVNELQIGLKTSTKAAILRLAIGVSLTQHFSDELITEYQEDLKYRESSTNDYFRQTIFPNDEIVYKILIQQHLNRHIDDDEFFPLIVNTYICKGIELLYSNFKLYKSDETLKMIFTGGISHDLS